MVFDRTQRPPLWVWLAPVVFLCLWSGGFTAIKVGLRYAEPLTLVSLRYAIIVAILLPVFMGLRLSLPRRRGEWAHLVAIGIFVQTVYFALCYVAIALGAAAGTVTLIISLYPILVALLAPRVVGERVGRARWTGLMLGLAGVAIVILSRSAVEVTSLAGFLAAAGAMLGMTAGTLSERRVGTPQHPVTANLVQNAVALIITVPVAAVFERMSVQWTWGLAASTAYLVLANSLLALGLLLAMVRRGEASRVSALFFLVPPMAAAFAWLVVDEAMPGVAWVGFGVAAVGVAIANRTHPLPSTRPPSRVGLT